MSLLLVLVSAFSDQDNPLLLLDAVYHGVTILDFGELGCTHLHKQHTKAEDVHFGGLERRVIGLRGRIDGSAWIVGVQLIHHVDGAIVCDFSPQALVWKRL